MMESILQVLRYVTAVLLMGFAVAACTATPTNDGPEGSNEHSHDEGEDAGDDHADDHGDDHGDSDEIDHHGNRIVDEIYQTVSAEGVLVEFTMENFLGVGGRGGETSAELMAGERAVIKFKISDEASGTPLTGLTPASWIDIVPEEESGEDLSEAYCTNQVEGYLSGALTSRPTVDLNSFFILALNGDASISVIDPMVDVVGMTQLFTLIQLQAPGLDWVVTPAQDYLFVTMPDADAVAVIDTESFEVVRSVDAGENPSWIELQPDGQYLWVSNNSDRKSDSGVTVIDAQSFDVAARFDTDKGEHRVAFSPDSHYAFVTNSGSNFVSVIDTEDMSVVDEIRVGREASTIAVSAFSGAAYVADASDTITIIDLQSRGVIGELQASRGITDLQFAPGGQWGFAVNPERDEVYVIDAGAASISHVVPVEGRPDQVSFSESAVYIRSSDFPAMGVIQLSDIDPQDSLSVALVPIGEIPPSEAIRFPAANAIHTGAVQGSMVVASPADDQVYYYIEGSQSTSGGFQGHGLFPGAALIVDRSLREDAAGLYTGRTRIPSSGNFIVAFMMQNPFVVHCFEFSAKPNDAINDVSLADRVTLDVLTDLSTVAAGERTNVRFSITGSTSGKPIEDIADVQVLIQKVGGNWNNRVSAIYLDEGVYEIVVQVPSPGLYTLYFSALSQQLDFEDLPRINFEVSEG